MTYMVNGTLIYATPEKREKAVPLLEAHRQRSLADEPGTLRFDFALARDDPTMIILQELYEDEAAFRAHMTGDSMNIIVGESKVLDVEAEISGVHGTVVG